MSHCRLSTFTNSCACVRLVRPHPSRPKAKDAGALDQPPPSGLHVSHVTMFRPLRGFLGVALPDIQQARENSSTHTCFSMRQSAAVIPMLQDWFTAAGLVYGCRTGLRLQGLVYGCKDCFTAARTGLRLQGAMNLAALSRDGIGWFVW